MNQWSVSNVVKDLCDQFLFHWHVAGVPHLSYLDDMHCLLADGRLPTGAARPVYMQQFICIPTEFVHPQSRELISFVRIIIYRLHSQRSAFRQLSVYTVWLCNPAVPRYYNVSPTLCPLIISSWNVWATSSVKWVRLNVLAVDVIIGSGLLVWRFISRWLYTV